MELYLFWTTIALLFFVLELFLAGTFFFLFLGSAAFITAGLSLGVTLSFEKSCVVFAFLTIAFLILFHARRKSQWALADQKKDMNNTLERLQGSIGMIYSIHNNSVKIKIGQHYWSAKLADTKKEITINTKVKVIGYEGMILLIEPLLS